MKLAKKRSLLALCDQTMHLRVSLKLYTGTLAVHEASHVDCVHTHVIKK